ncbi:MAG: SAM-dependent methyltransferase [Janthinobacterium lividum]
MTPAPVTIAPEPPHSPGVDALLEHSDALSAALYPPEFRFPVDAAALSHPQARLLVARRDGEALGCVALLLQEGYGEVKRLIVAPEARGLGIGRALLDAVEAAAARERLPVLRLETGPGNARALDLYREAGWNPRGPFGAYTPNPHSLFLEKRLLPDAAPPAPLAAGERLDAFMARANAAYYARTDPFSDFATAPEIAQAFGELLGAWAAATWDAIGRPDPVLLVELGPGRGTLMADALRVLARVAPAFRAALRLHLVETSPRLRAEQAARLPDAGATWHDAVSGLPPGPMLLLANEFLDALPIRQLVRRGAVWMERHVADGRFVEHPAAPLGIAAPDGEVVELGEAAQRLVAALAGRIASDGGAALFLDYGAAGPAAGDSLQALRDARPADPLTDPGHADLTAHVDFAALAGAAWAAGARSWGPVPQGELLARLGLHERTAALARAAPDRAAALHDAAARLADPDAMGTLFKALAIGRRSDGPPPGFATSFAPSFAPPPAPAPDPAR